MAYESELKNSPRALSMKLTLIYCETNEQCQKMLDEFNSTGFMPVSKSLWALTGNELLYLQRLTFLRDSRYSGIDLIRYK